MIFWIWFQLGRRLMGKREELVLVVRTTEEHILNINDFRSLVENILRRAFYGHTSAYISRKLKVDDPRRIKAGKKSWVTRRRNTRG